MSELRKIISENIKRRRKELGLSQWQLAEKCELSFAYIAHIEQGIKLPLIGTLERIANVLEVPASYFFSQREDALLVKEEIAVYAAKLSKRELVLLRALAKTMVEQKKRKG